MKNVYALVFVAALFISGCSTPVPLEFYPDSLTHTDSRIAATLHSVSVKTDPKSHETGDVDWFFIENTIGNQFAITSTGTGIPVINQWQKSIEDSLNRALLFTDNNTRNVSLFVDVMKVEMLGFGDLEFLVIARYYIVERNDGSILYDETISSLGSASSSEAFVGAVRARLAFVRSVKKNVSDFVSSLQNSKILITKINGRNARLPT